MMRTLTRTLAVMLAAAGAAAAQDYKPMPQTPAPECLPPIVDCALGFYPVLDLKTCSVKCMPQTPIFPEPGPRPLPIDPPNATERSPFERSRYAPMSERLRDVEGALKHGDAEAAASGLFKLWSGATGRPLSNDSGAHLDRPSGRSLGGVPPLPPSSLPRRGPNARPA